MSFPSKTSRGAYCRSLSQEDYKQMYDDLRKHYDNLAERHRTLQAEAAAAKSVVKAIKVALARCD